MSVADPVSSTRLIDRLVLVAAALITLALALTAGAAVAAREPVVVDQVRALAGGARGWPLLVHAGGEHWLQPLTVYPPALLVRLGLPPSQALALTAGLAGAVSLVLTYLLARYSAHARSRPVWSLVLMLATPAYLTHARGDAASLLLVAFIVTWCICVLRALHTRATWLLVAGGIALGLCGYTQPAGLLTAATYFIVGALLLRRAEHGSRAMLIAAGVAFVTLLPMIIWVARFPETYPDTLGRWAIHAAHVRNPVEGIVAFTRWHVLARRVGAYWDYFNPTFLFATGQVFTLVGGLLICVGTWVLARRSRSDFERLTLTGFFVAPLAGVLLDVERSATFAVMFLPFGAILGAYGAEHLLAKARGRD